jgi:hypothetical protein
MKKINILRGATAATADDKTTDYDAGVLAAAISLGAKT